MMVGITECNPYSYKTIRAKEINYNKDRKKLIVEKTLPVPKERTLLKVISVADMIEKYVKIEEPLRYKGSVVSPYLGKEKTEKKEHVLPKKRVTSEQKEVYIPPVEKTKPPKEEKKEYGLYQVSRGDALSKIAGKFNLSTKELRALNGLKKDAIIKIGQKLKLPMSQEMVDILNSGEYRVKSGDTLISIAKKFNLDPKAVAKFNHIRSNTMIRAGKKIKLPLPHIVKQVEKEAKIVAEKKKKLVQKKERKRVKMLRPFGKHKLRVTATAYSSHKGQTDSTPFLAAWNNRLRPGMKIIAVSRDLLTRYGMRNGTKVKIGGLPGFYRVRDKMNKRYRKRIDIYMGTNRRKALKWGRRSVVIYW